jgi:hypothetical protein
VSTIGTVVERLEKDIERWRRCELTSDEFSVALSHASRDFNVAYDAQEAEE